MSTAKIVRPAVRVVKKSDLEAARAGAGSESLTRPRGKFKPRHIAGVLGIGKKSPQFAVVRGNKRRHHFRKWHKTQEGAEREMVRLATIEGGLFFVVRAVAKFYGGEPKNKDDPNFVSKQESFGKIPD